MKFLLSSVLAFAILAAPAVAETSAVTINCPSAANCSTRIVFTVNGIPRPGGAEFIKHVNCSWQNDSVNRIELEVLKYDTRLTLDRYQFVLNEDERLAGAMSRETAYGIYIINGYHAALLNFHSRTDGPIQGSCFVYWDFPNTSLKSKK